MKFRDVNKLLSTHFGDKWRDLETLEYYNRVITPSQEIPDENIIDNIDSLEEISLKQIKIKSHIQSIQDTKSL